MDCLVHIQPKSSYGYYSKQLLDKLVPAATNWYAPWSTNGTTNWDVPISQYGAYTIVSDVIPQQGFQGVDEIVQAFGKNVGASTNQVISNFVDHNEVEVTVIE